VAASKEASVDALRLAAIVCGFLLLGGAATNWYGLRPTPGDGEPSRAPATGSPDAAGIG
jgi:hypothetical protein